MSFYFLANEMKDCVGGIQYVCPFWGTFSFPFLRDIQVCPFWGTFNLSFFMDIQLSLFEGHSSLPFLRDIQVCPFWGTFNLHLYTVSCCFLFVSLLHSVKICTSIFFFNVFLMGTDVFLMFIYIYKWVTFDHFNNNTKHLAQVYRV